MQEFAHGFCGFALIATRNDPRVGWYECHFMEMRSAPVKAQWRVARTARRPKNGSGRQKLSRSPYAALSSD